MTDTKFTQGPWSVDDLTYYVDDPSGYSVCEVFWDTRPTRRDLAEEDAVANAHLIAAAPELYEAMQEFCDRVERGEIRSKKTYAKFQSLLAKARGES